MSGLEYPRKQADLRGNYWKGLQLKVVSLDPGGTTGYTISDIVDGFLFLSAGQAKWTCGNLWTYLDTEKPDIIIYETFEYRNRARAGLDLTPVELIGVTKLYGEQRSHEVDLYPQTPGTGFTYFSDKKLKHDGIYQPGKPHAMDALRHLLHWWQFGAGYQYNKKGYGV